jgi:lipooligosaccharide transport system permease protein
VQLVRHAAFGWDGWADLGHVAVIVLFGLIVWRIAIFAMERKLVN